MNVSNRKMKLSREESRVFSRQSVLSVMDKFVQAVDTMNETVMVPSRLMDMSTDVDIADRPSILGQGNDYYAFYSMLNAMKNELLWGGCGDAEAMDNSSMRGKQQSHEKGQGAPGLYQRRLSTVSSMSLSDDSEADTESLSESDSGREMEFVDQSTARVARNFRHHLVGLYNTLNQLTDSALVLTCRYQQEVDTNGSS